MNDLLMTMDGDLRITDHDISATDSIVQAVMIRLRWWFGEWKFGPGYGVKYFEHVLVKNPNRTIIIREITRQILGVSGVSSVDDLKVEIDHKKREAVIKYAVTASSRERFNGEVDIWQSTE